MAGKEEHRAWSRASAATALLLISCLSGVVASFATGNGTFAGAAFIAFFAWCAYAAMAGS